jgi:hypothetical protein
MKTLIFFMALSVSASSRAGVEIVCTYQNENQEIKLINTDHPLRERVVLPSGVTQLVVLNDPWTLNNLDNYVVLAQGDKKITYSLDCKRYNKESK